MIQWEVGELVEIVQLLPKITNLTLVARQKPVHGNAPAELRFVALSESERAAVPVTQEDFVNMCENPSEDVIEVVANDLLQLQGNEPGVSSRGWTAPKLSFVGLMMGDERI